MPRNARRRPRQGLRPRDLPRLRAPELAAQVLAKKDHGRNLGLMESGIAMHNPG